MPRFRIGDFGAIERSPASPTQLRNTLSDMIMSSVAARATVDRVDAETGEYRIVVQGTLEQDDLGPEGQG